MPLDSPEAYERLGAHLMEIDPIFEAFLEVSGYSDNTGALGRYPHRSAILESEIWRKIDLQMMHDEVGEHYEEFNPSIPYSLWAGSWIDVDGWRYCQEHGYMIFDSLPYCEIVPRLESYLRNAMRKLEPITKEELLSSSNRTQLS